MQIKEIFYSIQGEGINIGTPSIFIRLSGCNLRCKWCDTKEAWKINSGKRMTTEEIIKTINKFPSKNIVITGGEPLLQENKIKELIKNLKNYHIEIETNGTIKSKLGRLVNQYNCSPKLSNSGYKEYNLKKLPIKKTYYKFVINEKNELNELKKFIKKHKLKKEKIILMPQGTKKSEIAKKMKWLAEICKTENFRLSPRLHIDIWSNQKGK